MDRFTIRKSEGYTTITNYCLRDQSISYGARGLLSFMLSLPPNWDFSFNGLVAISKEGKKAIRTMINELKDSHYIKISQYRNELGHYQYNYEVFEYPYDLPLKDLNQPTPLYRMSDERKSEKEPQINTILINKDKKDIIDNIDIKEKNSSIENLARLNLKNRAFINELIRTGYISEDDEQILLYDDLISTYLDKNIPYTDIYSSLKQKALKIVKRDFKDDKGNKIENKYSYLKSTLDNKFINSNKNENIEFYPEDDNDPFWEDYKDFDIFRGGGSNVKNKSEICL